MLGKGSILIVFGFILSFASFQMRMSSNVLATSSNVTDQFLSLVVYQTASSSMNLAINKVWIDSVHSDTFLVVANNCSCRTAISPIGIDTVEIRARSWGYRYDDQLQSRYKYQDSMRAVFTNNTPISKYFWFTDDELGIYWITGDSVWGPVHTNGVINTSGSPVFMDKVSAQMGISPDPAVSSAIFNGGWEIGVLNSIPTNMSYITNAATIGNAGEPINTKCVYDQELTLDFQPDGSVIRTVGMNPSDTVSFSLIAPTQALVSSTDIRVKGVFNGQATIMSSTNIWIDDDLVYASDPNDNPGSDDVLGLIASNNIYVTDNAPNSSEVNIQACLMAMSGSFAAENYASRAVAGYLNLTGSIVQKMRGPVGTFSGGTITSGFNKRYKFDNRLSSLSPPHYPFIKSLSLVSWWE